MAVSRPTRDALHKADHCGTRNARGPTCDRRHVLAGSEPTRGAPATVGNHVTANRHRDLPKRRNSIAAWHPKPCAR